MINSFLVEKVSSVYILFFCKMFCISIFVKNLLEIRRGYWNYLDKGRYLNFLHLGNDKNQKLKNFVFKSQYVFKFLSVFFIFFSKYEVFFLGLLIFSFYIEMKFYFKYHANLMFLYSFILLIFHTQKDFNLYSYKVFPLAIALTLSMVYFFTAVHKINNTFLSGRVVLKTLELVNQNKRNYFDFWKIKIRVDNNVVSSFMYLTVLIELMLPILLFSNKFKILGVLLGLFMHLGFTLLFPATLLHFSILSISTYVVFLYF